MSKTKKFYVVWVGRQPGVYDNWDDAKEQIDRYDGARYKSYTSSAEAAAAYRAGTIIGENNNIGSFLRQVSAATANSRQTQNPDWRRFPEIDKNGWAVDASCMGNPGIMEYQGVDLATGKVIFRIGPFKRATNNIGEYLAIVHALALQNKLGIRKTIYSDSRTGMAWVRKGVANTKLETHPENQPVRDMIMRANHWLGANSFRAPIIKWDTERWGEIPADFGRK